MNAVAPATAPRRERGQSLVEFSLSLMVFATILMLVFDMGRGVYAYSVIAAAAGEGARYGIVHPTDAAGTIAATRARVRGLDLAQMTVNVTYPTASHVEVQVLYRFFAVSPLVDAAFGGQGFLQLRAAARMRM
jgi:hypothetical protein